MRYQFHDFRLDTGAFELSRNGVRLNVEPQVIELLTLLVENRHRLVGKEELYQTIWAGKVVSEAALSSRIKTLRRVLGDSGREQTIIRTVHGKGFRFVAAATAGEAAGPVAPPAAVKPGSERPRSRPSVIVIPFVNLSSDPQQEYFSDGISADIIMLLSKHRWLNVCARNTSFGYKGVSVDMRQLGRDLNMDYAIEGSVQKVGERVRVTVQLVDIASGGNKWSEKFHRELDDLFSLQDEITTKVVARLEPEIGFAERRRVVQGGTSNLKAWDYFHLGVYHFFKFTAEDNLKAQAMLKKSSELDEHFGDAYAWWAYAVVLGMVYWTTPPTEELLQEALDACSKALSFDSRNATYYTMRARVQLARKEYNSAIQDNQTAISLNPTFAAAYCGLGDSLAYEARYEESNECFERAIALSPNDPQAWAFLTYGALAFIFMGDYDRALDLTERALCFPNCQYWALAHRVVAFAYLDKETEMRDALDKLLGQEPQFSLEFAQEKLFYLNIEIQKLQYLKGLAMAGVPESSSGAGLHDAV
ncbi:winged helix-turn-helix domain-containing tetratricopeptide repeat protein [Kineobactrum salinum]|uniref:Tetratricopeptide repeat protein n=1 Tax=Kineobactrum salinum TaxID=2708301 RepID=A0A6C0TWU9_9GAMM|nr:winged helix-turn-helix domain-containing protein [Kineobactrum salinum]QIB64261.1 tetratricopeptide repeat protein [Kineobactrum salinum]